MSRDKEIEKASVEYQMSKKPMALGGDAFADIAYNMNINPSFIAGAKWADKTMIDKACEYINNHWDKLLVYDYNQFGGCVFNRKKTVEQFRKAMEG